MHMNQQELRKLTLQVAQNLSNTIEAYLDYKMDAEELGRSMLDDLENMINQIVDLYGIDAEDLYRAMRMEIEDKEVEEEEDDAFGFGGDWWKHGKTT